VFCFFAELAGLAVILPIVSIGVILAGLAEMPRSGPTKNTSYHHKSPPLLYLQYVAIFTVYLENIIFPGSNV
jgi:hypothetical protein